MTERFLSIKRLKKGILAILALVLLPTVVLADQLEVRRPAYVYAEPGRNSNVLTKIDPADYEAPYLVKLVDNDKVNGYYHIQLSRADEEGWIYKTFVRRLDTAHIPLFGRYATVSSDASRTTSFTSSTGRRYKISRDIEESDEETYEDIGADDIYTGTDRKEAKTSLPDKSTANLKIQKLDEVLDSLEADEYMRKKHTPKITRQSKRVSEENVIVKVKAFLFAAKKEADNDYHLILCTDPQKFPIQYMTAEVTGIPESGPFRDKLIKPRRQFKQYFGNNLSGKSKYEMYDPLIPVEVTGPLFYDIDHPAGAVGPKGHRPETSWEIHPVIDIQFLQ